MGNWASKGVTLDPIDFDGDSITFVVKRLLVEDMQILLKFYKPESGTLAFDDPLEVCRTAQGIFPRYILSQIGMKKEDGTEFTLEEFNEATSEFYFVPLVGALFGALIGASTLKGQEKNSVPPTLKLSEALGGQSVVIAQD